ncbi:MAG: hypothetical protein AAGC55_00415 [Myxococcota bacterium]
METCTRIAWILLALVHVAPAAVVAVPRLTQRLYGVAPEGEPGILIVHRGALFLAIVALAIFAAFDSGARRAATLAVTLSVLGFLVVYGRAGFPAGALRTIALVDVAALVPLMFVAVQAFRDQGG